MLHDAHFHTKDPAIFALMEKHAVYGIVNAQAPQQYHQLKQWLTQYKHITISSGIHPWQADTMAWDTMEPIMRKARVIGEIGLDNVWCQVDVMKQYEIFDRSLAYASKHHKPVILHVKGMEKEALSFLRKYHNRYFVHWYSCDQYLADYMALDCYFSIGPSVHKDQAVMQVAKKVPLHRLLIESDGMDAISWCEGRTITLNDYIPVLKRSIAVLADIRKEPFIEKQLNDNYLTFLSYADDENNA